MGIDPEEEALRKQIFERMNFKETDELLAIWREADHEEWTELALEIVKEILIDRLGDLPPPENTEKKIEEDLAQDAEEMRPGANTYHNEKNLLNTASWARIVSWMVLWLYIIVGVLRMVSTIQDAQQAFALNVSQFYVWLSLLSTPLTGLMYFLILQAVAEGLYMLMDLEEHHFQLFQDRNNTPT